MTLRQRGNLLAPSQQVRVASDDENDGPLVDGVRQYLLDFVLRTCAENGDLQCEAASRGCASPGLFGFTSKAILAAVGMSSCSSSSRFGSSSVWDVVIRVALPPGRLRLATNPVTTESTAVVKTMGMVRVAASAARTATTLPPATITATLRSTRSAASPGSRSELAVSPTKLDGDVSAVDQPRIAQAAAQSGNEGRPFRR